MVRHFVVDEDVKALRSRMAAIHRPPEPWGWLRKYGARYEVELKQADGGRWRFRITRKHVSALAILNYGEVKGIMQPLNDYRTAVALNFNYSMMYVMGVFQLVAVALGLWFGWNGENSTPQGAATPTQTTDPISDTQFLGIALVLTAFMVVIWAGWFLYNSYRINNQLRYIFGEAFAQSNQDDTAALYLQEE